MTAPVHDGRTFGRIPYWDERNNNYGITEHPDFIKAAQLPMRMWNWNCGIIMDQGAAGSCVGHGFAYELAADPVPVKLGNNPESKAVEYYYESQKLDTWPGGAYPGATPFREGTSVLAGAKDMVSRGMYGEYRWAVTVEDMAYTIGYIGPVVLGVNWYEHMMSPDNRGQIRVGGNVVGGHCIIAKGVNPAGIGSILLRNSWGPGWGINGEAIISWPDLRTLMAQNGECCVPINRMYGTP